MTSSATDTSDPRPLILASASPRRRALLEQVGLKFSVQHADVDEVLHGDLKPEERVEILSERKARAVAANRDSGIVIGADTLVFLDDHVLEKPGDRLRAAAMLRVLRGRTHQVLSGLCLIDAASGKMRRGHRRTEVSMAPLRDDEIERYVACGESLDKAGAYGIQERGAVLIEEIRGDYPTVVGLPLRLLAEFLHDFNVKLPP